MKLKIENIWAVDSQNKIWLRTASIDRTTAIKRWTEHPQYSQDYTLVNGSITFEEYDVDEQS